MCADVYIFLTIRVYCIVNEHTSPAASGLNNGICVYSKKCTQCIVQNVRYFCLVSARVVNMYFWRYVELLMVKIKIKIYRKVFWFVFYFSYILLYSGLRRSLFWGWVGHAWWRYIEWRMSDEPACAQFCQNKHTEHINPLPPQATASHTHTHINTHTHIHTHMRSHAHTHTLSSRSLTHTRSARMGQAGCRPRGMAFRYTVVI